MFNHGVPIRGMTDHLTFEGGGGGDFEKRLQGYSEQKKITALTKKISCCKTAWLQGSI
jgi:hypothetical protein